MNDEEFVVKAFGLSLVVFIFWMMVHFGSDLLLRSLGC